MVAATVLLACAAYGRAGVNLETTRLRYIGPVNITETVKTRQGIEQITLSYGDNSVTVRGDEKPPMSRRAPSKVFYSVRWPDHAQIMSMDADGSHPTCLTPLTDSDYYPALSPDGTTIAFTTHRDNIRALYLMNPDGTNQRRLTTEGDAGLGAWSPDGSRLAFSSNRNGKYCIYVMKRDGTDVRRLTEGPAEDCPNWSPDGKTIVFESSVNPIWRIWVVNADGTGLKAISQDKWSERWPQWSPDGKTIVFTSYEHGAGDIYLMRANGSHSTRLTTNPAEDRQPFWAADGSHILFHSSRAGRFDIYVLDVATKEEHRMTVEAKDTADGMTFLRRIQAEE